VPGWITTKFAAVKTMRGIWKPAWRQVKPEREFALSTKGKQGFSDAASIRGILFLFWTGKPWAASEVRDALPAEQVLAAAMMPAAAGLETCPTVAASADLRGVAASQGLPAAGH